MFEKLYHTKLSLPSKPQEPSETLFMGVFSTILRP